MAQARRAAVGHRAAVQDGHWFHPEFWPQRFCWLKAAPSTTVSPETDKICLPARSRSARSGCCRLGLASSHSATTYDALGIVCSGQHVTAQRMGTYEGCVAMNKRGGEIYEEPWAREGAGGLERGGNSGWLNSPPGRVRPSSKLSSRHYSNPLTTALSLPHAHPSTQPYAVRRRRQLWA